MSGALASCIIPVFNGEPYLRQAVESILAQNYRPLEVLIVDDGSTDGSATIARSFPEPVRYLRQKNAGPAAARNHGISEARGSYLGFLDADDLWLPEKLARQVAELERDRTLACSVCLIQNFWMPELASDADRWRDHPRGGPLPGYTSAGMLVRREALQRVGSFDASLGHGDATDWFLRARHAGLRDRLLPEVLVLRRLHSDNRSRTHAQASRHEFLHLLKRSLDRRRRAEPEDFAS
jgi:glycosyltransferase involved in cell wall biosynthesis